MTESAPVRSAGSHRRRHGNSRLAVLLVSLLCVVVAGVLVVVALHWRGESPHGSSALARPAGSTSPAGRSPATSPTADTPTSTAVSPTPSAPSAVSSGTSTAASSATPGAPATSAATAEPSESASPGPAAVPAVDVLNDSRVTGLAAQAAAQLRAAGWTVATVGNFAGDDVPATTVFFPEGDETVARQLATALGVTRVIAAPEGLSSSNLTVALAHDWPAAG